MNRRTLIAGTAILAAILTVSAFATQRAGGAAEAGEEQVGPRVRVEAAAAAPANTTAEFPASVVPADQSSVGFTRGGRVQAVEVSVGEAVDAGTVLAVLDRRPFEHARSEARARLREVSSRLEQAERDLRRARALGNATTEQELEQRRTAVARLEAERTRARVAVSEAERQLEETVLTAPYAGEVVRRFVDRGEVVSGGAPVVLLSSDEDLLEIELALPERARAALPTEDEVEIRFPLSPGAEPVRGRIAARAEHATNGTGLFEVTVRIPAEAASAAVRPGMMASVAVPQRLSAEVVAVSPSAVAAAADGEAIVYAVTNGRVSQRQVTLLDVHEDVVLLAGDVEAGDELVVSGHYALIDGEEVEVVR